MLQYLKKHQIVAIIVATAFTLSVVSVAGVLLHKSSQPAKAIKSNSTHTNVAQSETNKEAAQTNGGSTVSNSSSSSVSVSSSNGTTQVTQSVVSSSSYDGHEMNPQNTIQPNSAPTGVKGHVYRPESFNQCPNGGPGVTCNLPLQKTIKVLDSNGDLVKTVSSDSNGYFETTLAPGPYTLIPESCNPEICYGPSAQNITVQKAGFTEVTFYYFDMMSTN